VHLERLVELEYLLVHRGSRGQSFFYELVYDGQGKDGGPFLSGLVDVAALRAASTTASLGGQEAVFVGVNRPETGALPAGDRGAENAGSPAKQARSATAAVIAPRSAHKRMEANGPSSYVAEAASALAVP
jgi:hypothetical protein